MYSGLRPPPRCLLLARPTRSSPTRVPAPPGRPAAQPPLRGPWGRPPKPSSRVGWVKGPGTRDHDLHARVRATPGALTCPRRGGNAAIRTRARGVLPPPAGARSVCGSSGAAWGGAAPPRALLAAFQINFQRRPPAPAEPRAAASSPPPLPAGRLAARGWSGTSFGPGGGGPRGCRERPARGRSPLLGGGPGRDVAAGGGLLGTASPAPRPVTPRGEGRADASRRPGGRAAARGPGAGAGRAQLPGRIRPRGRAAAESAAQGGWGARGGGWSASRGGAAALRFRAGCRASAGRASRPWRPPRPPSSLPPRGMASSGPAGLQRAPRATGSAGPHAGASEKAAQPSSRAAQGARGGHSQRGFHP